MKSNSRAGSSKKKGGRKKKAAGPPKPQIEYDFAKLMQIPKLNWVAKMTNGKIVETIEGTLDMTYSFNKIKEKIQEKHSNSCSNLRLYILESKGAEDSGGSKKTYLDDIMYKTFDELKINTDKFTLYYEFEPYIHPMLEASLV